MLKWSLTVLLAATFVVSCTHLSNTADLDRSPNEATEEDPWTTWSVRGTPGVSALLQLRKIRETLLSGGLYDPHLKNPDDPKSLDYSMYDRKPECPADGDLKYRSADGTCYRSDHPLVGAAGVAFSRNVHPDFLDKRANDRLMIPKSPLRVSETFFTRDTAADKALFGEKYNTNYKPVPFLNMIAASWIQFMNHDWLTHGENEVDNRIRLSSNHGTRGVVDRTKVNKVPSHQYAAGYDITTINEVTHWWDASQIYGSNQGEQDVLRTKSFGKMKLETKNGKTLLPSRELDPATNVQNQGAELTGFMDNWWVGLSMLHTLFVKEHNAIADHLRDTYVETQTKDGKFVWTGNFKERSISGYKQVEESLFTAEELDEKIFQLARLINAAVLAKIHTIEWTPAILKNDTLRLAMFANWYGLANPAAYEIYFNGAWKDRPARFFTKATCGYTYCGIVGDKLSDYGVPYSISEEFTSVYRLHSLLPEELNLRQFEDNKINKLPFLDSRNEKARPIMEQYGLKDLLYSFGTQYPGQLVLNNFPNFMQRLTIPGRGLMDLGMVDVLRDRERGTPRYNQFRAGIHLKPIKCYFDFFDRSSIEWDHDKYGCDREKYFDMFLNSPIEYKRINEELYPELKAKKDVETREQALADRRVEIERRKAILAKFDEIYGQDSQGNDLVEEIDLLVGTLAEEVRPKNFGFGETMFQIFILMASRRLMADPFFTTKYNPVYYTKAGIEWIDMKSRFADVITRHMPELAPKLEGLDSAFSPWKE